MKALFIMALSVIAAPASAEVVSGPATVADGDTLDVGGRKIRLFGIDAPELKQTCDLAGQSWTCGEESARQLRELVGSRDVHCAGYEVEQYDRLLAVCTGPYGELNKLMVEHGWATAFRQYSQKYIADELRARSGKQGLWASSFVLPQEYRAAQAAALAPAPRSVQRPPIRAGAGQRSGGCLIKGNRNRRGQWIYHMPGAPYYDQTRAEEFFCSEEQAQAAGYRRSKAG